MLEAHQEVEVEEVEALPDLLEGEEGVAVAAAA